MAWRGPPLPNQTDAWDACLRPARHDRGPRRAAHRVRPSRPQHVRLLWVRVRPPISGSKALYVNYLQTHAMARSSEAGHTYNRGYLEFNDYRTCIGCGHVERMIAVVSPQAYVYGLGEVPPSWPMQAMEAQAVAGRTYAEYLAAMLGQHRSGCNCDLYDDTRSQVYAGWDHEGEVDGTRWVQAVDQTDRRIVLYQGRPIDAQ